MGLRPLTNQVLRNRLSLLMDVQTISLKLPSSSRVKAAAQMPSSSYWNEK